MKSKLGLIEDFFTNLWNDKSLLDKGALYENFSSTLIINSPIGKKTGLKDFIQVNDQWNHAFPDMEISKLQIECFGDVVVTDWMSSGRHENPFMDFASEGKKVVYPGETCFFFEGDKIVRYSCKINMAEIYRQLGYFYKKEEYTQQALLAKDQKLLIGRIKEFAKGRLTQREIQSLSLYLLGFSLKQIGVFLFISPRTVETHVQRAISELQCSSKQDCLELMMVKEMLPLWGCVA